MDAKPDNFILSDQGIVPIDLQIGAIGKSEVGGLDYGEGLRTAPLPDSPIKKGRAAFEANRALSYDAAAFGQFIDQLEGRGFRIAELPQEKFDGRSITGKASSTPNEGDRVLPGNAGESGLSPEGEIRRSRELAIAVFQGKAAADRSYLSEGSESVVERIGEDWVVKAIVPAGVMSYTRDGKLTRSASFVDVELKARFISGKDDWSIRGTPISRRSDNHESQPSNSTGSARRAGRVPAVRAKGSVGEARVFGTTILPYHFHDLGRRVK